SPLRTRHASHPSYRRPQGAVLTGGTRHVRGWRCWPYPRNPVARFARLPACNQSTSLPIQALPTRERRPAPNQTFSLPLRACSIGAAVRVASARAFRYPRAPMELRGRWGLVSGAARRIGRSIALAGRGLNVEEADFTTGAVYLVDGGRLIA